LFGAIAGMIIVLSAYIVTNFIFTVVTTDSTSPNTSGNAPKKICFNSIDTVCVPRVSCAEGEVELAPDKCNEVLACVLTGESSQACLVK
jgi:hypothetical protein